MNLFAFYVGGAMPGANIELHDAFFCAANTMKDCHDDLRRQWWGTPESLHIDCWGKVTHIGGYDIELKETPYRGAEKLYFVNLGGYDKNKFIELHENIFVIANSLTDAKGKALQSIQDWFMPHKDYSHDVDAMLKRKSNPPAPSYEVENILPLDSLGGQKMACPSDQKRQRQAV